MILARLFLLCGIAFFFLVFIPQNNGLKAVGSLDMSETETYYRSFKSSTVSANSFLSELIQKELYFSAVPYAKEILRLKSDNDNSQFSKIIDTLYLQTGTDFWRDLPLEIVSRNSEIPSFSYLLAFTYYDSGNRTALEKEVAKISPDHPLYPMVLMLRATSFEKSGQYDKAISDYTLCQNMALKFKGKFDDSRDSLYEFTHDSCEIAIPRTHYKANHFELSSKLYENIDKRSFKWPAVLFENSWNSFRAKNYNLTLGKALTFNAPILDNYFFPETHYLSALSYLEMCLWDDAINVIKRFDDIYVQNGKRLIALLNSHAESGDRYFVKLLLSSDKDKNDELNSSAFLRDMLGQMSRRPYVTTGLLHLKQMQKEQKVLNALPSSPLTQEMQKNVERMMTTQIVSLDYYIKKSLYSMANEIIAVSEKMTKVHLEVFSRKRETAGKVTAMGGDKKSRIRGVGDPTSLFHRGKDFFWSFDGEFWADELGDYVLNLTSECTRSKGEK